jgi:hypothetical protein
MEKDGYPYRMVFTTAVPGIPSPGVSLESIEVGRRLVAKDVFSTMHSLNAARARCSTGRPGFCWLKGVRKTAAGVEPASTMFPNGLQDAQHLLRAFARHQGAPIGEASKMAAFLSRPRYSDSSLCEPSKAPFLVLVVRTFVFCSLFLWPQSRGLNARRL